MLWVMGYSIAHAQCDIPNGDFEEWITIENGDSPSYDLPVDWTESFVNLFFRLPYGTGFFYKYTGTDANGNAALLRRSNANRNNGFIRFDCGSAPEKLKGRYKFTKSDDPSRVDTLNIIAYFSKVPDTLTLSELHQGIAPVEAKRFTTITPVDTFTDFEIDLSSFRGTTYDYAVILFVISTRTQTNMGNSTAVIDDLRFEYPDYNITFHIKNGTNAIADATVILNGWSYTTDRNGMVTIPDLPAGIYNYTVRAPGFEETNGTAEVIDANVEVTESLTALVANYTVTFQINDGTNAIDNATVSLNGTSYITDTDGIVAVTNLPAGTYNYVVQASGFEEVIGTVDLVDADVEIIKQLTALVTGSEKEISHRNRIKCYPNPVKGLLTVEIPKSLPISYIEIRNVTGKILEKINIQANQYLLNVDLSSYPSSLLLIRVSNNENMIWAERIVKD